VLHPLQRHGRGRDLPEHASGRAPPAQRPLKTGRRFSRRPSRPPGSPRC
jgi:hypothetical protein